MMLKAQADPLPGEISEPSPERLHPKIENIEMLPAHVLEWHGDYKVSKDARAHPVFLDGLAFATTLTLIAVPVI